MYEIVSEHDAVSQYIMHEVNVSRSQIQRFGAGYDYVSVCSVVKL